MIDPVEQLVTLIYQVLLNEYDRRHRAYYDKLDNFCRRLYHSKPDKAFISRDFLELIELYSGLVTYDEVYKEIWSLVETYYENYKRYKNSDK